MIMGIITSVLDKKERPLLMGILNVTPDSFFPGSRAVSVDMAVEAARRLKPKVFYPFHTIGTPEEEIRSIAQRLENSPIEVVIAPME